MAREDEARQVSAAPADAEAEGTDGL